MPSLIFDPEARDEMRVAAVFYEDCQTGLGQAFLNATEAAVAEIVGHPLLWRRIRGRFHRYLVHRFPYCVIYTVYGDVVIYVAAVMHLKRKPDYWLKRIRA